MSPNSTTLAATARANAPVLFISHGAPTFATEPGQLGPLLQQAGQLLTNITAMLVVSSHWQTRDFEVQTTLAPETVHDFGGFPQALYQLRYPALGHPELATAAAALLRDAGWSVQLNAHRGLDHGAWVPLMHLLPHADVPVFQVSLPLQLDTAQALQMGQVLAPLRAQGVAIIGSGSVTHNLHDVQAPDAPAAPYATEFAAWVRRAVITHDSAQLRHYRSIAPHAMRAHPSEEHFLPLLVAIGATQPSEAVRVLEGGITYGVLAMDAYVWGLG